jgi:anion-transporting  ArsA/GET3 family ATPase
VEVLRDLSDFLQGFHGMYEGFERRAAVVRSLLAQPDVGFVLVSSPAPLAVDEALMFHERLHAESMPVAGAVANRVTVPLWEEGVPFPDAAQLRRALGPRGAGDLAERLAVTLAEHQLLARADAVEVARFFAAVEGAKVLIPRLESDVHDLGGLQRLAERL